MAEFDDSSVEEELYREQLEREQERARKERQKQGRKLAAEVAKQQVKKQLKKAGKKVGKKALERAGATAAAEGAAAVGTFLPWILLGLAVILAILVVVAIMLTTVVAACNQEHLVGRLVTRGASYVVLGTDVCSKLEGFRPIVTFLDQTNIPQVIQDTECPNVEPPPRVEVGCIDCIDLRQTIVPVKEVNTNSLANQGLASRLSRVITERDNTSFRVTEAFCPVVYHSLPNHYNGFAVDVGIKPEVWNNASLEERKSLVTQLMDDVLGVGFTQVLCEYSPGLSDEYDCRARDTTAGSHIHLEEPNALN